MEAGIAPRVLALAIAGDAGAQEALFDAHADRVYRLAYRMTGDRAAAQDITQDVFARVFDRLDQFRGDAPFGAWLHRVAVTTILNAIRKSKARTDREASLDEARYAQASQASIEPDQRDRVRQALAGLPAPLRLVVIMFDIEGYTHDDIGAVLGITSGASRVRLLRARESLRAALAIDAEEWST
jgi:RNA polymerase sigma-70 factor (ECF subfamily)